MRSFRDKYKKISLKMFKLNFMLEINTKISLKFLAHILKYSVYYIRCQSWLLKQAIFKNILCV